MKKFIGFALACALAAEAPMGRTTDWWSFAGDGLRDGWEKSESRFTQAEVKDFKLLWQRKLDGGKNGALLPPLVLGQLIGYRGFKELAFVAGSGNRMWAIDADLNRMYFDKPFDVGQVEASCNGELTAAPSLPSPVVFRPGTRTRRRDVNPVFLLTADGLLRRVNQEDGSELQKPVRFVPRGLQAQPLNVLDDVVYTSTRKGCFQEPAVWKLDTNDNDATAVSAKLQSNVAGLNGVIVDADGKAFVETEEGEVIGFSKELKATQHYKTGGGQKNNLASPTVFTYRTVQFVVAAGRDGRLHLLKSGNSFEEVSESATLTAKKSGAIWGGISSWEAADGTRYVLAPVWGQLSGSFGKAMKARNAKHGAIVAFKLDGEKPELKPLWVSADMDSPTPPVIAQGIVFALSNKKHATLYALDGLTGQQLFSSGDQVQAAGNLAGISVANGRIYFATTDNTLQVFGKYLEW